VSNDITRLVRAAQDPGNTLLSLRLPHNAALRTYDELKVEYKRVHSATIVAVADDARRTG